MGSEKLSRALRAAKFVGGEVDLSMDKNHLSVSVTVEAGEGVNVKFESGELSDLVCEAPTPLNLLTPIPRRPNEEAGWWTYRGGLNGVR